MPAPDFATAVPFFQPILAPDLSIYAYEVLARERRDGTVRSLGPYFEDPNISDQDKMTLDLHIRKLAFEAYAASGSKAKLFVNIKPSWVYLNREVKTSPIALEMLQKCGIDPSRIVIEITEEELIGDYEIFRELLTQYRKAGCMLAVDDFGRGASNVERIAYIAPDLIKIDRSIVQRMDTHRSFYELCRSLSAFGSISGFELLFEGVETASQLERCTKAGWCYLQGYIFSQARPGFDREYDNKEMLSDIFAMQSINTQRLSTLRNNILTEMETEVQRLRPLIPLDAEKLLEPTALHPFADALPYYCMRCFVCDINGRRVSQTCHIGTNAATSDNTASGGLLHSHFIQGWYALQEGRSHYLSCIYKDIVTKENVALYMQPLDQERVLCIDIMSTMFM